MVYGLEARAPWLDYRIAELAFRLPPDCKLFGNTGKFVFRHAVAPYVPKLTLVRKKMGFSVPMAAWLRTSLKPIFESVVLSANMEGFLSLSEVRHLWRE